jgi:hypothetical protein
MPVSDDLGQVAGVAATDDRQQYVFVVLPQELGDVGMVRDRIDARIGVARFPYADFPLKHVLRIWAAVVAEQQHRCMAEGGFPRAWSTTVSFSGHAVSATMIQSDPLWSPLPISGRITATGQRAFSANSAATDPRIDLAYRPMPTEPTQIICACSDNESSAEAGGPSTTVVSIGMGVPVASTTERASCRHK